MDIFLLLTKHGYAGIDEHSKIRYLQDGIKMLDDLNMIKGQILAMAVLCNDFDMCVMLFRDYLLQVKADKVMKQVTIAAVTTSTTNCQGHENVTPDTSVEDHYYKVPEYKHLSCAKKLGLKLLMRNRVASNLTRFLRNLELESSRKSCGSPRSNLPSARSRHSSLLWN